jgi:hypothetical protein
VRDLEEANAILEAQRAELSSDRELLREAEMWRDASPQECFAAVIALCRDTDHYLRVLAPDELERALEPDPLPPSTLALLARDPDR